VSSRVAARAKAGVPGPSAAGPLPRVLFVGQTGQVGGAELSLVDTACRHRERSEVLLFADGPFRRRLEDAGVRVTVAPGGGREAALALTRGSGTAAALAAAPGLARLVATVAREARRFDLVYANSQKAFVAAAAATAVARRPLLWHLRDILTEEHFGRLARTASVGLANLSRARVVADSRATARAFVAAGGREDSVSVVYNGIDAAPFDAVDGAAASAALRRELGCGPDAPLLASFSRLSPWKGQHVLIEALRHLPGAHAVLVGGALFGEDAYEASLRRAAAGPGVAGRVHLLGFRDDVPALARAVDVVVHSSVSPEPFGRVIVEGMLAGKPVVAAGAGGAVEIVEDGVNGLLAPPGDAAALAASVRGLLADPGRAAALARRGREDARRRFSPEAHAAGIDAVLVELAAAGQRRRQGA
jgi:glycosyltransferase involved in cell wall biosynthesis